jgi:predicted nuclease of predicted toxin-antitoxin system
MLLLDQNIARSAVKHFASLGVNAVHVANVGLANKSDREIWRYASRNKLIIVTKDSDFAQIHDLTRVSPVRVVWLRLGNTTNRILFPWLTQHWPHAQALLDQGHLLVELK